jgi:Protein of unknown function (DUF3305)
MVAIFFPMNAETSPLNRNDALQKIGPIAAHVVFEQVNGSPDGWRLIGVSPTLLREEQGRVTTELELWLHRDECEGYYLNLESPEPSFFVKWRLKELANQHSTEECANGGKEDQRNKPEAIALSVSYDECGRWLDGGESVDRVLMPLEMLPWLAEFTQLHYEPEGKKKKSGPKPSFMSRKQFSDMTLKEIDIHKGPNAAKEYE